MLEQINFALAHGACLCAFAEPSVDALRVIHVLAWQLSYVFIACECLEAYHAGVLRLHGGTPLGR